MRRRRVTTVGSESGRLSEFINYLRKYFMGTVKAEYRELFVCKGDPRVASKKDRGGVWVGGLDAYISTYIRSAKDLDKWNIYMGVGFWLEPGLLEPVLDKMLYDRLAFDFDDEYSPETAVVEAVGFANVLYRKHGVKPIVFETGFKGAHVVIPLSKPVDWSTHQLLWKYFYGLIPPAIRRMVDLNMLQWNRVDRVPLTYNVKEGDARFCRVIYPREFTWSDFTWDELQPLDPSSVTVVSIEVPSIAKPKVIALKPRSEKAWIWRVVEAGLPDGRKRFMLMVLIPYLVVAKGMSEEDVLAVCSEFVENSCRNFNKCDKVYDSWIKSAIRSAKSHGFRGFSLEKLREKDPELYSLVVKSLETAQLSVHEAYNAAIDRDSELNTSIETITRFINETGKREFSYGDFKEWLEAKNGKVLAREWHKWERVLRLLAEKGYLGRKYLVNGEWVDYGPGKVDKPPSKVVKFYIPS